MEMEANSEVDSTRALVNHWRIFRLIGLNPPNGDTWWGRHYRIYSALVFVHFNVLISVSFMGNLLLSNTLETICENLCTAIPHLIYVLKMFNVVWMRRPLLYSHQVFRRLDGRLRSVEERRIVGEGVALAQFIFRQVYRGIIFANVLGILYIVVSSERTLTYPAWIPWNWQTSSASIYLATVTWHIISLGENCLVVLVITTYPGMYLILLSAHTKALAHRLSCLGYDSRQTRDQVEQLLIGCIRDHQTILHLFKVLERSLSMTCFMQFFGTVVAQCTICYFLMFARVGFMRFAHMLVLLTALSTETVLHCYTSELLCQEGDNLLAAVYSCNWLDQSIRFQRLLIPMLMRCQRPLILVAGVLVPVRMKTLMAVGKGAYTMLTVLNEMREHILE